MIKNCITDSTEIMTIEVDNLPELTEENYPYYDNLAKIMSDEMGVPKDLLINGIHFFFIHRWHKIDNKWYFFKGDNFDFHFINELLGEVISEYFDLKTVHYKVAKLIIGDKKPEIGVISENFCSNDYQYTRIFDYPNLHAGDIFNLESLRDICSTDEEFKILFSDFKKFMIRDFYTSQGDRSGNNFLFQEPLDASEGKRLSPLYDYENAYEMYPRNLIHNALITQNMEKDYIRKYLKKDNEYQEILSKVRDADMQKFINEVQDRHNIIIPNDIQKVYLECDKKKKEIIKNNRLVKVLKPKHQNREIAS